MMGGLADAARRQKRLLFLCLAAVAQCCAAMRPCARAPFLRPVPAAAAALTRQHGNVLMAERADELGRADFLRTGAAAALAASVPVGAAHADDGIWAAHAGPFTDKFFKDFTRTDSGISYKFVRMGEGEKPVAGQRVFVHYTGYLLDGKRFDSSYDTGKPFKFRLGGGKVISGWEATVGGMRPGMRVIVKIPPQYAYGDKGAGDVIPPGATLVFYMELVSLGNVKQLKNNNA